MDVEKYFVGKGLNASKINGFPKMKHIYVKPDNFYTLRKNISPESLDFIYSEDINETKFFKILLKEWFYSIKVEGNIIIKIKDNPILGFDKLLEEIGLLLGEKGKIVIAEKRGGFVIYKKNKLALEKNDSIDKWSFGILSDGSKQDVLEQQIKSIIALKIPHFEIIICGKYSSKNKRKFLKVIDFPYKLAWITRKKNLIVKNAKYENIVMTHNRFNFDKNWYEGMKRYGNYFEVLMCRILDPRGRRAGDWLTYGRDIRDRWINDTGLLEYEDWDSNLNINGSFYILKKSSWKKCPWDESRVWGQSDDDWMALDFHEKGLVPRFNKHSTIYTFPEIYGEWHWKYDYDSKKLGKIHCDGFLRYISRKVDHFFRIFLKLGLVRKPKVNSYGWANPNEYTTTEPQNIKNRIGTVDGY